jgi:hypothetical protein
MTEGGLTHDNATNSTSAGIPVIASAGSLAGMQATDLDADSVTYSLVNRDGSALADSSGTAQLRIPASGPAEGLVASPGLHRRDSPGMIVGAKIF